jgi:hypothetical protein
MEIMDVYAVSGGATSDVRTSLMAQAIAAQINIDNGDGDPGYNPNSSTAFIGEDLVSEAVQWLRGNAPFDAFADGSTGNVDTNRNGILDPSEFSLTGAFTSPPLSATQNASTQQVPLASTTVTTNGHGLENALAAFNANQLVVSLNDFIVGWNPTGAAGATPTDQQSNTPNQFWQVLQDQPAFIHANS